MVIEYIPEQICKDCGYSWPAEYDPHYLNSGEKYQCPKCGSENLDSPPIKKDGPFEGPEIQY